MHLALTQHMHMDVMHGLPTQLIAVHHHAEAFRAALLIGQALGGKEDVPGQELVVFAQLIEGTDVFFRDHQKMHRRLRADIVEGDDLIIFIQLARGDVSGDDLAEQTIHGPPPGLLEK